MSAHDYWLEPPETCDDCDQDPCACWTEHDQGDRQYHDWRDEQLMEWGD